MSSGNKTCKLNFSYLDRYMENSRSSGPPQSTATVKVDLYAVNADDIACDSHPGFVRAENEDSFLYCTRADGHYSLAAVADGVGGQLKGAEASRLCLSLLVREWASFLRSEPNPDPVTVEAFLHKAVERINQAVFQRAFEVNLPEHMCTTLALLMFAEKSVVLLHAGDSRIYRLQEDRLECLTRDHTLVNDLVSAGVMSPEEAMRHPYSHVISRSVGASAALDPEIRICDHLPGDRFLLCSDGLSNLVSNAEIQNALASSYEPAQAIRILRDLALQRGGTDNITLVCVFA